MRVFADWIASHCEIRIPLVVQVVRCVSPLAAVLNIFVSGSVQNV